jgi:hypothetical protein
MSSKDWEEWLDLLREAHREPIAPAHYAAVRARVLAELGRERRPAWRVWACGVAAAVVVAAVMLFPKAPAGRGAPTPFVGPVPTASVGPSAFRAEVATRPPELPGVAFRPEAPPARRRHVLAQARQPGRPGGPPHLEPVTIKLLTDDPNVIIYWFGNGEGE